MKSSSIPSVLGIEFERGRLTGVWLRRSNGGVRIDRSFESAWSLEGLMEVPERMGGDLREALDKAKIRERYCMVCIPLEWAYTTRIRIPALPEADVPGFLKLQAEREFPIPPEETILSISRWKSSEGVEWATLIGVPANRIDALSRALRAANLRPLCMTFAVTSVIERHVGDSSGSLVLLASEDRVDLAIEKDGAVLALRSLDEGSEGKLDASWVVRQIRITLGQFTGDLRETIDKTILHGAPERTLPLLSALQSGLKPSSMKVDLAPPDSRIAGLENAPASAPVLAAAKRLLGQAARLEFLRIPTNPLKRALERVSSKSNLWLGGVAAGLILLLGGGLLVQQIRLARLQSEWAGIAESVGELTVVQDKIRRFRPWFDDSIPSLAVARILTEAFPEEGSVWMKSLKIEDRTKVTCSGQARGNREWMAMVERLRETPGVLDLQVVQVRGAAPLQFTLSFRWDASYRNDS